MVSCRVPLFASIISLCLMSSALAIEAPGGVSIGQSLEEARPIITDACNEITEQEYRGPDAAPAKEVQTQINCLGLKVFERQSKVEYMFNDGVLAFVWFLLEPEILTAMEPQLLAQYGAVAYENENYRVFESGVVALRKSPPEILIASPEMMRDITGLNIENE